MAGLPGGCMALLQLQRAPSQRACRPSVTSAGAQPHPEWSTPPWPAATAAKILLDHVEGQARR